MFYYHLDLFKIIGGFKKNQGMDPDRILALISRLPDTSQFYATLAGAEEWQKFLGWGEDRQVAAGIYDLLTVMVRGSINWQKGKEPKIPAWDRPSSKTTEQQSTETSEDEDLAKLMRVVSAFGPGVAAI